MQRRIVSAYLRTDETHALKEAVGGTSDAIAVTPQCHCLFKARRDTYVAHVPGLRALAAPRRCCRHLGSVPEPPLPPPPERDTPPSLRARLAPSPTPAHTSAYVSIRQHTSAYVPPPQVRARLAPSPTPAPSASAFVLLYRVKQVKLIACASSCSNLICELVSSHM